MKNVQTKVSKVLDGRNGMFLTFEGVTGGPFNSPIQFKAGQRSNGVQLPIPDEGTPVRLSFDTDTVRGISFITALEIL